MGFHVFQGFATTPPTGHKFTQPNNHAAEEQYLFHPVPDLTMVENSNHQFFGDRSSWSQVQERPDKPLQRLLGGAVGVRVDTAPPGVSEASAKNGGIKPVQQVQQLTKIKKRSLRRAICRAHKQGQAVYRGKKIVAHPDLMPRMSANKVSCEQNRLACITWNVGGLTQVLMAELLTWLAINKDIQILMLQETHWGNSCDWEAQGWFFCHSASPKPRSGGVLIALRRDIFAKETVRWQEVVPGRLLHVRAFAHQQHVDLLTIYQHALPFGGELLEDVMKKRSGLWKELDRQLGSFPARSSIVLGGDFNCVLEASPPHVGFGIHPGSDRAHLADERKRVGEMLRRYSLCALNSWQHKRYTYRHPSGKSQIDYLVVRKSLADSLAKGATPIEVPMAGWRSSGHFPVKASLRWDWRPWKHAASIAGRNSHETLVPSQDQNHTLAGLKKSIVQSSCKTVSATKPQVVSIDGPIKAYWQARARFKAAGIKSLKNIFERFKLYVQMTSAHRELRRAARARKVQQHQQILEMAEDAAAKGDSKGLYRCVRWLSLKSFRQGIRLRTSQGSLMSPAEECQALAKHATNLFSGKEFECPDLLPLPARLFTAESWAWALSQLKSGKAVPRHEPAVQAWKDNRDAMAAALATVSQQALCCDKPSLPQEWCTVQLAWLPKPSKSPTCPANLRSIGLLPADSKGFLLILRRAIHPFVQQALIDTPQYAYRPQAGTMDALLRSSLHCAEVRGLLAQHQSDHMSKVLNEPRVGLAGGFMCSLDLAKAFDSVPHHELYASLCEAGVPTHLAVAIMQVHCRTVCVIDHGGHRRRVHMTRGLRQGCPIAPILYACWTVRLCRQLDAQLGEGWSRRHLSIFADDTHGSWVVRSERELNDSLQNLRVLIETLQSLGLAINYTKSQIVIQLRGHLVGKVQKRIFKMRHGAKCLRLQASQDIYLPCVDRLDYLGTILSYTSFEAQTALHRVSKADTTFRQLRQPLRSRSALTTGHRLRLYHAILLSSLTYGLIGVGVTLDVLRKVSSVIAGHMRKILRVYEHGISNDAVLQRAKIDPLAMLLAGAQNLQQTIVQDTLRGHGLKQKELTRIRTICEQLQAHAAQPQGTSILFVRKAEACEIACPECGVYFGSREGLAQHLRKKHPETADRARIDFDRAKHSLFGIPMCRFCQSRLHDWSSLSKHLQDGNCAWVKEKVATGYSPSELPSIIEDNEARNPPRVPHDLLEMQSLERARQMLDEPVTILKTQGHQLMCLAKQCVLCAQRVRHATKIKTHWQQQHASAWDLGKSSAHSGAQSLVAIFSRPCQFCGSGAKDSRDHATKCPAIFQFLAAKAGRKPVSADENDSTTKWSASHARDSAMRQQNLRDSFTARQDNASSTPRCTTSRSVASSSMLDNSADSANASGHADMTEQWILRLRLTNPGNHCYANAAIVAMLSLFSYASDTPAGLRALRRLCQDAARRSQAVILSRQFVVRSCAPRWNFSSDQQDAVEFITSVMDGTRWHHGWWEARSFQEGTLCQHETGRAPLLLPVPEGAFDLQDAIQAWHDRGYVHALTSAPQITLLQLARYVQDHKNIAEAHVQDFIMMPVFKVGLEIKWIRYQVVAAILHYGPTPQSGHYRSHLKLDDQWFLTDDGIEAVPQPILQEHRRNVYAVWIKQVEEGAPGCSKAQQHGSSQQGGAQSLQHFHALGNRDYAGSWCGLRAG